MNNTKNISLLLLIKAPLILIGSSFFIIATASEPTVLARQQDAPPTVRMRDNPSSSKRTERPKSEGKTSTQDQLPGKGNSLQTGDVRLGMYPTLDSIFLDAKTRHQELKSKSASTSPRDLNDAAKDTLTHGKPVAAATEPTEPKTSQTLAPGLLDKLWSSLRKSGPAPSKPSGPNPEIRQKSFQPQNSEDILK